MSAMNVKCDRCRRDLPPQDAIVRVVVNERDYRFVCRDCAFPYLEEAGDLELLELELTAGILEEAQQRGLTELAAEFERRMRERGWVPPDTPELAE